jgi:hypothetical protein
VMKGIHRDSGIAHRFRELRSRIDRYIMYAR